MQDIYDEDNYQNMTNEQLQELFDQFQPKELVLETIYVPFLQELKPEIGDVDCFVKIPPPNGQQENLGTIVLDEPNLFQSDPQLLNIKLYNAFNITIKQEDKQLDDNVKNLKKIDKKAIEEWVKEVEEIHMVQGPASYNYTLRAPADTILELWDQTMEQILQEYDIPKPNIDLSIYDYARFCCMLLDIPIGDNVIESLHMFFQNYSDIINQQNLNNYQDQQLQIQIQDVSSQEPEFPCTNVLTNDPLSPGWKSQKYAQMPQEIIFKIPYSQISQIQFVLHEQCTPELIEIYISKDSNVENFLRIGHVKRNPKTSKNCRERKTLKISMPATLIKLVIQSVVTENNPYNQCGLCAVCIKGQEITNEQSINNGTQIRIPVQPQNKLQVPQNPHIKLAEDVKHELQIRKQQQIQLQNFLEANRFKIAIDKLTQLQSALQQLELKKVIAIEKEDYIAANDMKENIEQIEKVIEMPVEEMICFCNGEKYEKTQYAGSIRQQIEKRQQITQNQVQNNITQQSQQQPQQENKQEQQNQIPQQNAPINNEEQAIQANKGWLQVDDNELKELERERKQRALQKLREREEQLGNKVSIKQPVKTVQKELTQSQTAQVGNQQIFAYKEYDFNFNEQQQALLQFMNIEPVELPRQYEGSEEVQLLQSAGIDQLLIGVLTQKNIEHIQQTVEWFITLLRVQPIKYQMAAYAAISMILKSQNIALLGIKEVMQLIFYYYIACLYKNAPGLEKQIELDVEMPDIDELLSNQKEQAVIVAYLTVFNKTQQDGNIEQFIQDSIQQNQQQFNNDMMPLLNQLISRVCYGQKRPRLTAINVLTTLASFPAFPASQVFSQLLTSKINIEGQKDMRNIKYANIIEQRVAAASMMMQYNIYLAEIPQVQNSLTNFIKELLPQVTKSECKNHVILMMQIVFQQVKDIRFLIDAINHIDSVPLLKQIVLKLNEIRKILTYQEQQNKVVIAGDMGQQEEQFQNQCQFCLWQISDNVKDKTQALKDHLIKDCSCCCICPACHQVVEIAIIYQHIITECTSKNSWFQHIGTELQLCPKCQLGIPKKDFNEHLSNCKVELQSEDQAICPLCQMQLNSVEETLDHYCQNACNANPRTSQKLLEVIQNKVNKV